MTFILLLVIQVIISSFSVQMPISEVFLSLHKRCVHAKGAFAVCGVFYTTHVNS